MKRIGLIDVDGHNFPNLALMKLSAWHKAQGDTVEWYSPFVGTWYDCVYCSKVFSDTPDVTQYINAYEVVKGGTGYALHGAGGETYSREDDKPLPDEVEHIYPDYTLYKVDNTAIGFLTRGCPRGCDFCIVGKKEGRCSRKVADLNEFWRGQRDIILCDPNILACTEWEDLLHQLEDSRAAVYFNQGLGARLLTPAKCEALSRVKMKGIHFAWDRYEDGEHILPKLKMFAEISKAKPHSHNAIVYVLTNHGTTLEQDLERIYRLRELGYWAYVMIYDKAHAPRVYRDLQRWCNSMWVFARCPRFEDYKRAAPPLQATNFVSSFRMNHRLCRSRHCMRYKELQSGERVCRAAGRYIPVVAMSGKGCRQLCRNRTKNEQN